MVISEKELYILKYENNVYFNEYKQKYIKKLKEIYRCLYSEGLAFYYFEIKYVGKILGKDKDYETGVIRAQKLVSEQTNLIIKYCISTIPYIENVYITVNYHNEKEDELRGYPYYKGIISVPTMLGNIGECLLLNIKNKFSNDMTIVTGILNLDHNFDLEITYLSNLPAIFQGLNSVLTEHIFKNHYIFWFKLKGKEIPKYNEIYDNFSTFKSIEFWGIDAICYGGDSRLNGILESEPIELLDRLHSEPYEIFNRNRNLTEYGLISMLNSYMLAKNYYYSNGKIYEKQDKDVYVYKYEFETFLHKLPDTYREMLKDQFVYFQLQYFDFDSFMYNYIVSVLSKLRAYPHLLTNCVVDIS